MALALVFDIHNYDRDKLNKLTDQELYELYLNNEDEDVIKAYTLDELSEAWNDEELNVDGTWMYIVRTDEQQNNFDKWHR